MSTREIARRVGVASSTVRLTLRRCEVAGIAWPLDAGLTDAVLEQRLFANAGVKPGHRRHAEPDWVGVHREMRRKHVRRRVLRCMSPEVARTGHAAAVAVCPLSGPKRTSFARSEYFAF
jgi:hypothetical protein